MKRTHGRHLTKGPRLHRQDRTQTRSPPSHPSRTPCGLRLIPPAHHQCRYHPWVATRLPKTGDYSVVKFRVKKNEIFWTLKWMLRPNLVLFRVGGAGRRVELSTRSQQKRTIYTYLIFKLRYAGYAYFLSLMPF